MPTSNFIRMAGPLKHCCYLALLQVNYINAHATSTLVGDIAEVKAIKQVFTETSQLKMNSTKSLIGHCLVSGCPRAALNC